MTSLSCGSYQEQGNLSQRPPRQTGRLRSALGDLLVHSVAVETVGSVCFPVLNTLFPLVDRTQVLPGNKDQRILVSLTAHMAKVFPAPGEVAARKAASPQFPFSGISGGF